MSATYDALDDRLIGFIQRQKLFFVATAPLSAEGSVNLSPKGYDSLAIIDALTIAYLDLGGSGAETIAHLRENAVLCSKHTYGGAAVATLGGGCHRNR